MIFGLIFLAITIVGLIEYFMLDGWISFTTVFLCSLVAIGAVYGDINFVLFVIAFLCSSIIMIIIWAVAEIIKEINNKR